MQFLQSRKSKNTDESFCAIAIYLVITKNELNVYTTWEEEILERLKSITKLQLQKGYFTQMKRPSLAYC